MTRLVGLGVRQRGSHAGGNAPSPFKLEQESALSAQVSRGLAQVLKGGGGEITLRLRPEQLGEVRAQVRMEHGVVSVRIEAASEEARSLLERDSSSLRSALEARGLTVEHVRVEGPARSAERLDQASSEMTREREDRTSENRGEDRPAEGDRRNHDQAAQGRAPGSLASEMMRGASVAPDVRCAYGAAGWSAGASWVGADGVIRLDATA
jgi:flagellar hook-length control protein FliK